MYITIYIYIYIYIHIPASPRGSRAPRAAPRRRRGPPPRSSRSAPLGFSDGTLERRYSRIMLSPPQTMKPYLGHYARIMRAYSLLRVLLCFPILLGHVGRQGGGVSPRALAGRQELRAAPAEAVRGHGGLPEAAVQGPVQLLLRLVLPAHGRPEIPHLLPGVRGHGCLDLQLLLPLDARRTSARRGIPRLAGLAAAGTDSSAARLEAPQHVTRLAVVTI